MVHNGGYNPANTKYLYNVYTMLGQRRRRWVDVLCLLGILPPRPRLWTDSAFIMW